MKCRFSPCNPTVFLMAICLIPVSTKQAGATPFSFSSTLPTLPVNGNLDIGAGNAIHISGVGGGTVNCDGDGTDVLLFDLWIANDPVQDATFNDVQFTVSLTVEGIVKDIIFSLSGSVGPGKSNVRIALVSGLPTVIMAFTQSFTITPGMFLPPSPYSTPMSGGYSIHVSCASPPGFPVPSSVTTDPLIGIAGTHVIGQVNLDRNAPTGGCLVTLNTSSPFIAFPAMNVFVPAGQKTATFPVVVNNVGMATLSATLNQVTKISSLQVIRRPLICLGDIDQDADTDLADLIALFRAIAGLGPAAPCL